MARNKVFVGSSDEVPEGLEAKETDDGKTFYEPNSETEKDDEDDDPCWEGYEMVGTKIEDGEEVPNCVPKDKAQKVYVGGEEEVPEGRQLKEDEGGDSYYLEVKSQNVGEAVAEEYPPDEGDGEYEDYQFTDENEYNEKAGTVRDGVLGYLTRDEMYELEERAHEYSNQSPGRIVTGFLQDNRSVTGRDQDIQSARDVLEEYVAEAQRQYNDYDPRDYPDRGNSYRRSVEQKRVTPEQVLSSYKIEVLKNMAKERSGEHPTSVVSQFLEENRPDIPEGMKMYEVRDALEGVVKQVQSQYNSRRSPGSGGSRSYTGGNTAMARSDISEKVREKIRERTEKYSYDYDGDLKKPEVRQLEDAVTAAERGLQGADLNEIYDEIMQASGSRGMWNALTEGAARILERESDLRRNNGNLWSEAHHEFLYEILKPSLYRSYPELNETMKSDKDSLQEKVRQQLNDTTEKIMFSHEAADLLSTRELEGLHEFAQRARPTEIDEAVEEFMTEYSSLNFSQRDQDVLRDYVKTVVQRSAPDRTNPGSPHNMSEQDGYNRSVGKQITEREVERRTDYTAPEIQSLKELATRMRQNHPQEVVEQWANNEGISMAMDTPILRNFVEQIQEGGSPHGYDGPDLGESMSRSQKSSDIEDALRSSVSSLNAQDVYREAEQEFGEIDPGDDSLWGYLRQQILDGTVYDRADVAQAGLYSTLEDAVDELWQDIERLAREDETLTRSLGKAASIVDDFNRRDEYEQMLEDNEYVRATDLVYNMMEEAGEVDKVEAAALNNPRRSPQDIASQFVYDLNIDDQTVAENLTSQLMSVVENVREISQESSGRRGYDGPDLGESMARSVREKVREKVGGSQEMEIFEDYIEDIDVANPQGPYEMRAANIWSDYTRDEIDEREFQERVFNFVEDYSRDTRGVERSVREKVRESLSNKVDPNDLETSLEMDLRAIDTQRLAQEIYDPLTDRQGELDTRDWQTRQDVEHQILAEVGAEPRLIEETDMQRVVDEVVGDVMGHLRVIDNNTRGKSVDKQSYEPEVGLSWGETVEIEEIDEDGESVTLSDNLQGTTWTEPLSEVEEKLNILEERDHPWLYDMIEQEYADLDREQAQDLLHGFRNLVTEDDDEMEDTEIEMSKAQDILSFALQKYGNQTDYEIAYDEIVDNVDLRYHAQDVLTPQIVNRQNPDKREVADMARDYYSDVVEREIRDVLRGANFDDTVIPEMIDEFRDRFVDEVHAYHESLISTDHPARRSSGTSDSPEAGVKNKTRMFVSDESEVPQDHVAKESDEGEIYYEV